MQDPWAPIQAQEVYVEEGEEVKEVCGEDVPRVVVERFVGMPWPVPFRPVALAQPFEYSNGALVRKVPDQCLSDWAEVVRSWVGDLATAVESKIDKAIAVALDGFLRMPVALRRSRRGGRKGRSELYFRVKRFLE